MSRDKWGRWEIGLPAIPRYVREWVKVAAGQRMRRETNLSHPSCTVRGGTRKDVRGYGIANIKVKTKHEHKERHEET
ncbi:hypothetical protein SUGI_0208630 [Cryptomeria japonica]|nr:hypothetical protein SUGI_0208630 [Cryptomeria japonica]